MIHPIRALDEWWSKNSSQRRLDRHPLYICVLLGILFPALSIVLLGPVPSSALAGMAVILQIYLCALIVGGCVTGLVACRMKRVKHAYRLQYSTAPAIVAALAVYGVIILSNVPTGGGTILFILSALSGVLTPLLGVGIGIQAVCFWLESRRIERNEEMLTRRILDEAE